MPDRSAGKAPRVRRTIKPQERSDSVRPLRRTLWGISGAEAKRQMAEQERHFAQVKEELERQIILEKTERQRLNADIDRCKERLQTLRNVIQVLRSKLARERAARAVLAARLIDRQAEEMQADQEAALSAMRLEGARLSAEILREHESVRDLVAALYRTVAGRMGIPAALEVNIDPPPAETQGDEQPPSANLPGQRAEWHRFLAGKIVGRPLLTPTGQTIARVGAQITDELIRAAEEAGMLFELMLTMKLPPSGLEGSQTDLF